MWSLRVCCLSLPSRAVVVWCSSVICFLNAGCPACSSVRRKEVRVELLIYLHHLLAGEAAAGGEFGDRFEVVILSTRQAPVEHAPCRVADVLEAVHDVARDEDDGAGADRRGLVTDGHLIGALDDEKY